MIFKRKKTVNLFTHDPEIQFILDEPLLNFSIRASKNGVQIMGNSPIMPGQVEFYDMFKTVQEAFTEAEKLKEEFENRGVSS